MRKKPNPKLVGAFVLGALVLLVLAVAVFGSSRWFRSTQVAVAYFDRSVAGLNSGAPVTFRGVRVGQVKDVALKVDAAELSAQIPVYLEFQLDRVDWSGQEGFTEAQLARMVDKGLRAKLVPQSLVTGQLMVELNFEPGTPARHVGTGDVPEIPTTESEIQALLGSLSKLPVQDLMASASQALTRLNQILGGEQMDRLAPTAVETLEAYRKLAEEMRARLGPLADEVGRGAEAATGSFRQADQSLRRMEQEMTKTLETIRMATERLEAKLGPLSEDLRTTSGAATGAFEEAQRVLNQDSRTQRDLRRALEEFANAARAVRALAEKLERNPNALITGKQR